MRTICPLRKEAEDLRKMLSRGSGLATDQDVELVRKCLNAASKKPPKVAKEALPEAPKEALPEAPKEALPEAPKEALPEAPKEALPEAPMALEVEQPGPPMEERSGLAGDLGLLHKYVSGGPEERRLLLEGELFTRCIAAVLFGGYTSVLEVDAGVAGGCELDSVVGALRVNLGETKYNPAELPKARLQLTKVGKVAAYTLDRAMAACFAEPTPPAPPEVLKLPRRLVIHGVILYVGTATSQQLAPFKRDDRIDMDGDVLRAKGLHSAELVLSTASARESVR
ncbi:hypothetical protein GPECTOR_44g65 [Gonium pectorale]|uniref:Uncharacterized protein n=1 Tax=Gonium pectorale TaxID=33097 RepID=A0A150G957_GONPE|nr:hypothetical protein GPECTOR_44g65 [Gonium pectorale]|eukprot:KXZ46389.1 hypothetical protein GPECTOR_44g65 [Gonium pectorale]